MMVKYRVLRKTFGYKKDEVTGDCRKLLHKNLHGTHSSSNIIRVMKSRRLRCEGMRHIWRRAEVRGKFWLGSLREKNRFADPDVDGETLLNWIFKKEDWRMD
jgi:hypothetical protein